MRTLWLLSPFVFITNYSSSSLNTVVSIMQFNAIAANDGFQLFCISQFGWIWFLRSNEPLKKKVQIFFQLKKQCENRTFATSGMVWTPVLPLRLLGLDCHSCKQTFLRLVPDASYSLRLNQTHFNIESTTTHYSFLFYLYVTWLTVLLQHLLANSEIYIFY